MTAIAETLPNEPRARSWRIDLVVLGIGAATLIYVVVAFLAVDGVRQWPFGLDAQQDTIANAASYAGLALCVILPIWICWRRAIVDGRLPARNGAEPRYEHIDGWGSLFLLGVGLVVAWLVWWATTNNNPDISGPSGTGVVAGLAVAFILVAWAPMLSRLSRRLGLDQAGSGLLAIVAKPVERLGEFVSGVDGFLVFAIAPAVGASQTNRFFRYLALLTALSTCATLAYYWTAPWSFIPIAWGFLIAFSVSRRWAWIETERNLAMLNPTLSQTYIRVGFALNLRDEALIAFMSMFLLVPLALMQGQNLANQHHVQMFAEDTGHPGPSRYNWAPSPALADWVSFYGTELAKALPFVDWAEVYEVRGGSNIGVCPDIPSATICNHLGQHAVFATRVLIDLVFLAALIQAMGIATRDAQQRDLFYKKRAIRRLDPFTEPDALRGLVRRNASGEWEQNGERFDDFPEYDTNRLVELQAARDERTRAAVNFLLLRDGAEADPNSRISLKAADKSATSAELEELLVPVQQLLPTRRNVYLLSLTRTRLLSRPAMANIRREIVRLIVDTPHSLDRTEGLIAALTGERREPTWQVRDIALSELAGDVGINDRIRNAIQQVADHDAAIRLREKASAILKAHPETPD